ncbi:MAG: InlB B-repeat-containing protein, partial [Clostridiales Family XIII bacterium]|nr:InlB B-repeat-containing protein [Clostridiales Family XIII bacterium]
MSNLRTNTDKMRRLFAGFLAIVVLLSTIIPSMALENSADVMGNEISAYKVDFCIDDEMIKSANVTIPEDQTAVILPEDAMPTATELENAVDADHELIGWMDAADESHTIYTADESVAETDGYAAIGTFIVSKDTILNAMITENTDNADNMDNTDASDVDDADVSDNITDDTNDADDTANGSDDELNGESDDTGIDSADTAESSIPAPATNESLPGIAPLGTGIMPLTAGSTILVQPFYDSDNPHGTADGICSTAEQNASVGVWGDGHSATLTDGAGNTVPPVTGLIARWSSLADGIYTLRIYTTVPIGPTTVISNSETTTISNTFTQAQISKDRLSASRTFTVSGGIITDYPGSATTGFCRVGVALRYDLAPIKYNANSSIGFSENYFHVDVMGLINNPDPTLIGSNSYIPAVSDFADPNKYDAATLRFTPTTDVYVGGYGPSYLVAAGTQLTREQVAQIYVLMAGITFNLTATPKNLTKTLTFPNAKQKGSLTNPVANSTSNMPYGSATSATIDPNIVRPGWLPTGFAVTKTSGGTAVTSTTTTPVLAVSGDHWSRTSGGVTTVAAGNVNTNLTFTEQWKVDTAQQIYGTRLSLVSFNKNGDGASTAPATIYFNNFENKWYTAAGGTATWPANPTRTGYTFAGWNTSPAGTGTTVSALPTLTNGTDVTYYAKWTRTNNDSTNWATISFDGNKPGATNVPSPIYYHKTPTLAWEDGTVYPANPTRAGYNFVGWTANSNG